MIFYLPLISILMWLAYLTRSDPKASHTAFKLSIFVLFILVAFRYQVGCDWTAYEAHYLRQTPGAFADTIPFTEPSYWLLMDAIHFMELPFETINVITSLIFFIGFYILGRTQPNPMTMLAIAFPILIFALPMSAIRQAAAMGFLMPALIFFVRKKLVPYCILVVIAFSFHTSAIAFILLAPFIWFRFSTRNILILSPILIFILLRLLAIEGVSEARIRYTGAYRGANTNAAGAPFRTAILFMTGLFFFAFVRAEWKKFNNSDYNIIVIGGVLLLTTFFLQFTFPTISDRFGYYFIIFQVLIFSRLHFLKLKNADLWLALFFIGTIVFFTSWWLLSWQLPYCYEPYRSTLPAYFFSQN